MRPIDADRLKKQFSTVSSDAYREVAHFQVVEIIDHTPTLSHAGLHSEYICSECKAEAPFGINGEPMLFEYCPNCGAALSNRAKKLRSEKEGSWITYDEEKGMWIGHD